MNGLYTAGGLFGALFSSWLAELLGRKKTIFAACITATIGGALQAGSVDLGMFIFVRFISGLGVGKCYLSSLLSSHPDQCKFSDRMYKV